MTARESKDNRSTENAVKHTADDANEYLVELSGSEYNAIFM